MPSPSVNGDSRKTTEALLGVTGVLVTELHPRVARSGITLDSRLDRDLGLDSLARLELLTRLERGLGTRLDDQEVIRAETLRDVLASILRAAGSEKRAPAGGAAVTLDVLADGEAPGEARTLVDVLAWHAAHHPARPHIYLVDEQGATLTYADLMQGAQAVCAGLAERGLEAGTPVALMLPTSREYFFCFAGILLAGGVPVPIYPPFRPAEMGGHLVRQAGILENAGVTCLITAPEARPFGRLLKSQLARLREVLTPEDLAASRFMTLNQNRRASDTALLQYTSGSTGRPKGVVLTHENLLANIRAMGQRVQASSDDVFVSWLPLYHDMGLIGAWLSSMYFAMPLAVMAPLSFLARPARWLRAIQEYHGTLSAAPNFAFELCLRRIEDPEIQGVDLSSLRMMLNGAEPVSPETISRFSARFEAYGFRPTAMTPVYGLAESSVGLTFPPPGRGPVVDRICREPFMRAGRAEPADPRDTNALRFMSAGKPLAGHDIRIVDPGGRELPERQVGRLEFRGPSATSGYFRNPEASAKLYHGEWLDSGDLAYVVGGEVYITGRLKDIIIRAGRNIVPQELEEAVGDIPGIRKGCVAAFPSTDPASGTERLVIVAETRETRLDLLESLHERIQLLTVDLLGLPPDDTVLTPPRTVPKTSSGKIRRAACRELYEHGELLTGSHSLPGWRDRFALVRAGMSVALERWSSAASEGIYAAYAWLVFKALALVAFPLVLLPMPVARRRALLRGAGCLLVRLLGIPIAIHGRQNIPASGPYVLIANHSSYLDAFALEIGLGPDADYVATRQLLDQPFPRLLLPRLGILFVDPRDPSLGEENAQRLAQAVCKGKSLLVFPEGGLPRSPGLRPFHMGAFLAAAKAGVPVIPVTIRGTRAILRPFTWIPRRGAVDITIGSPVEPEGTDWDAALKLRNATRSEILRQSGERDIDSGG